MFYGICFRSFVVIGAYEGAVASHESIYVRGRGRKKKRERVRQREKERERERERERENDIER